MKIYNVDFKKLADDLNCRLDYKDIYNKRDITKGFVYINILDDNKVTLGQIIFQDGDFYRIKSYKKDYHREIDDGDAIIFRLDKYLRDGILISWKEFCFLAMEAEQKVRIDLWEKKKWRKEPPKKGRKKLEGKNPRFVLFNMIQEYNPKKKKLRTVEDEECKYCGKEHDSRVACSEYKEYCEIQEMLKEPNTSNHNIVINFQGSESIKKYLESKEGQKVIIDAIQNGITPKKRCPIDEANEVKEKITKVPTTGKFNLWCKIFGHKPPVFSYTVGGEYAKVIGDYPDGVGRRHADVYGECPRCQAEFKLCKIHIPSDPRVDEARKLMYDYLKRDEKDQVPNDLLEAIHQIIKI